MEGSELNISCKCTSGHHHREINYSSSKQISTKLLRKRSLCATETLFTIISKNLKWRCFQNIGTH